MVVSRTPPNLGKFAANLVVNRASGGAETPRPNIQQIATPHPACLNEAGELRLARVVSVPSGVAQVPSPEVDDDGGARALEAASH